MKIVKLLFSKGFDVRYKWYIDNSKFFDKKTYKNSKTLITTCFVCQLIKILN